jgi:NMD protein affecting ribosome stability and mRNA decay
VGYKQDIQLIKLGLCPRCGESIEELEICASCKFDVRDFFINTIREIKKRYDENKERLESDGRI